jgi:hypothetical protein
MKLATLLSQPLVFVGHTLRNQHILLIVYMVFTPQVGHLYILNLCHHFTFCAVLYLLSSTSFCWSTKRALLVFVISH